MRWGANSRISCKCATELLQDFLSERRQVQSLPSPVSTVGFAGEISSRYKSANEFGRSMRGNQQSLCERPYCQDLSLPTPLMANNA